MPEYKTESQKAYEAIREAILSGELLPGEKLPQRKLADRFNTTTITIREALRSLENEGLVIIEPKWGAMVEEITPEKIYGRYIVREALEGMSARMASSKITPSVEKELLDMAKKCDDEVIKDNLDPVEKANLHCIVHEKVNSLSECMELILMIQRINLHSILLSNAFHINWKEQDRDSHTQLVKAIISGDPDIAEKKMREHVRIGFEMEKKALQNSAAAK